MMKIPRQSYPEEFKQEALKRAEGGQRPAEVARQPGIDENILNHWRKAAAANLRLKMKLEIVENAAAYFAKGSL